MKTLQGVAAVLYQTMTGRPMRFGAPSAFPVLADAPVVFLNRQVGQVQALWVEGDRVHWIGRLTPESPLAWVDPPPDPIAVPLPEPTVAEAIDRGWLVGVPALTQASTHTEAGCTVITGWTVCRMELLRPAAAPWPGLTLHVR